MPENLAFYVSEPRCISAHRAMNRFDPRRYLRRLPNAFEYEREPVLMDALILSNIKTHGELALSVMLGRRFVMTTFSDTHTPRSWSPIVL